MPDPSQRTALRRLAISLIDRQWIEAALAGAEPDPLSWDEVVERVAIIYSLPLEAAAEMIGNLDGDEWKEIGRRDTPRERFIAIVGGHR